jgi:hypothetical protein
VHGIATLKGIQYFTLKLEAVDSSEMLVAIYKIAVSLPRIIIFRYEAEGSSFLHYLGKHLPVYTMPHPIGKQPSTQF